MIRPSPRRVVDDELAFHVEMQIRRYVAQGMSRQQAEAAARERFGDIEVVRAECHAIATHMEAETRRRELLEEIRQDLSFAVRTLARAPVYTIVALLTLAVGIGANTAIFSVVHAALLEPLPYRHASRLVTIYNASGHERSQRTAVAAAEFADYLEQQRSFDAMSAIRVVPATIAGGCVGESGCAPEELTAHAVSPNFFELLGLLPQLGRNFVPDDGVPLPATVAILSDALWRRRYAGDSAIIGRTISVNGIPRIVVGVAHPEMRFPDAPVGYMKSPPDLYFANAFERRRTDSRGNQNLVVLGRLKPSATFSTARADVDHIAARFRRDFKQRYVEWAPKWRLVALPLTEDMFGDSRPMLLTVFAAAALILLIACANVANLALARGAARARELAVRAAIGAGRGRLVRQLLTESLLLALLGGMLGTALAIGAIPLLVRLDPGTVPRFESAHVNARVLLFSLGASTLAGVLFGLLPALRFSSANLRVPMTGDAAGRTTSAAAGARARRILVVGEVAVALVVLVAAGLLVRTFAALQREPIGLVASGVQTFHVALSARKYDSSYKVAAVNQRLLERVRSLPGTMSASGVHPLPLAGNGWSGTFRVEGRPEQGDELPHAEYTAALPDYFKTMGIALLAGRDFTMQDDGAAPAVVIVDEALAEQYWPGESAVGKRVNANGPQDGWQTVIGVVAHVRRAGPRTTGEPQVYLPMLQNPQPMTSFVSRGPAFAPFAARVRALASEVDRDLVVARVRPMEHVAAQVVARERFNLVLFAAFGLVGLVLATVGLYGVTGYLVTQRTQELAIRMALGGPRGGVMRLVLREAVLMTVAGLVVGVVGAMLGTRLLKALLFGVSATDPWTYGAIAVLLVIVAVVAAIVPGIRATRIDPIAALRG